MSEPQDYDDVEMLRLAEIVRDKYMREAPDKFLADREAFRRKNPSRFMAIRNAYIRWKRGSPDDRA